MKLLKNKTTSKKVKFEAFNKLSEIKMKVLCGGQTETPVEDDQNDHSDGL